MFGRERNDTFHVVIKEDWYNKGDIITFGDEKFVVVKTHRRTLWRLFLLYAGLLKDKYFVNTKERCVIKIKKI